MRKLTLTGVAACLIIGCAALVNAVEYNPGIICVEFADGVNLERKPGTKGSGHNSLDLLAEKYDVYEVEAVFPMPKEPIKHPHGLWDWEDWQRSAANARLKYVYVLRFAAKVDPLLVVDDYKRDPYVVDAAPEGRGKSYMFPNDPDFDRQWYLYLDYNRDCDIHFPEAWDRFLFHAEPFDGYPIAGVIDTGIYTSTGGYGGVHQDIQPNMGVGFDLLGEPFPEDIDGHGTAVAGIIGAKLSNGLGIAGVGVDAVDIMPVRTHYHNPVEPFVEGAGMVIAVNMGADLLNMSWGFDYPALEIQKALEHAWDLDIVTVAASGDNPDISGPYYAYPAVDEDARMISMGGSLRIPSGWQRWEHSGYHDLTVDVIAPASPNIYTTWLGNGYANKEGTSYSCAMGSGIAGACLAMLEGPYGGIDVDVRECIHHGGANWGPGYYPDEQWGWGTEYYERALDCAIEIKEGGGDGSSSPAAAAAAPALRLAQNAPNPASTATTFRLELSAREVTRAKFVIYDLSGRKVRTFDVPVKDGAAEVAWDLTASDGARVAPGVYIYRVRAGNVTAAKKCVVN